MKGVLVVALVLFTFLILGFSSPQDLPHLEITPTEGLSVSGITYPQIYSNGIIVCTPADEYKFQFYIWNRENYTIFLQLNNISYIARGVDGIFNSSAIENGGEHRHILFDVDNNCEPIVRTIFYTPTSDLILDFWNLTTKLWTTKTRPIIIVTGTNLCGATWVYNDSTKDISKNYTYSEPVASLISIDCLNAVIISHELAHALGAVQNDAPHSDGSFHCADGYDLLCSNSSETTTCPQLEFNSLLDCNGDDYFSTMIFSSSQNYLATHLNIADSPFLDGDKYIKKYFFPMVE